MRSQRRLGPTNPLLRRVRQHANITTLFRSADPAPLPGLVLAGKVGSGVKAVIQPKPTSLPVGQTTGVTPAPVPAPATELLGSPASFAPPVATDVAPVVSTTSPGAEPVVQSAPEEKEDLANWARLQNILSRHEAKQAQEQAEASEQPTPTGPAADVARAIEAAEAAPDRPAEGSPKPPALEEAWPVERTGPSVAPPDSPLLPPSPPDPVKAKQIQTKLDEVTSARPTDSSIELHLPRRPRPKPPAPTEPEPAKRKLPFGKSAQRTPASPKPEPAAEPEMVPTEIGPLPADLWEHLGEKPPGTAEETSGETSPGPATGATTGTETDQAAPAETAARQEAIQRAISAAEAPSLPSPEQTPAAPAPTPDIQRREGEATAAEAAASAAPEPEQSAPEPDPGDMPTTIEEDDLVTRAIAAAEAPSPPSEDRPPVEAETSYQPPAPAGVQRSETASEPVPDPQRRPFASSPESPAVSDPIPTADAGAEDTGPTMVPPERSEGDETAAAPAESPSAEERVQRAITAAETPPPSPQATEVETEQATPSPTPTPDPGPATPLPRPPKRVRRSAELSTDAGFRTGIDATTPPASTPEPAPSGAVDEAAPSDAVQRAIAAAEAPTPQPADAAGSATPDATQPAVPASPALPDSPVRRTEDAAPSTETVAKRAPSDVQPKDMAVDAGARGADRPGETRQAVEPDADPEAVRRAVEAAEAPSATQPSAEPASGPTTPTDPDETVDQADLTAPVVQRQPEPTAPLTDAGSPAGPEAVSEAERAIQRAIAAAEAPAAQPPTRPATPTGPDKTVGQADPTAPVVRRQPEPTAPLTDAGSPAGPEAVSEAERAIQRAIAAAEAPATQPPTRPATPTGPDRTVDQADPTAPVVQRQADPTAPLTDAGSPAGPEAISETESAIQRAIAAAEAPPAKSIEAAGPEAPHPSTPPMTGKPDTFADTTSTTMQRQADASTTRIEPGEPSAPAPASEAEATIQRAIAAAEAPPTEKAAGTAAISDHVAGVETASTTSSTEKTIQPTRAKTAPASPDPKPPAPSPQERGRTEDIAAAPDSVQRAIEAAEAPAGISRLPSWLASPKTPVQRRQETAPPAGTGFDPGKGLEALSADVWHISRSPQLPPTGPPSPSALAAPVVETSGLHTAAAIQRAVSSNILQRAVSPEVLQRAISAAEAPPERAEKVKKRVEEKRPTTTASPETTSAIIQRDDTDISADPIDAAISSDVEGELAADEGQQSNIEELARLVYSQIKRRLSLEWERGRGRW